MSTQYPDNLLNPNIGEITLAIGGFNQHAVKEELMGEAELDELIMSQQNTQVSSTHMPVATTPPTQVAPQIQSPTETEFIHTILPDTKTEEELGQDNDNNDNNVNSEEKKINFNLDGMNSNLDEIVDDAKERIKKLDEKQKLLDSRVGLLEKFIRLDEKDLASECLTDKPNMARIGQIQKSIQHRTELLSQVLDISLKYEDTIIKWSKTIMDVEKDKVSAFQKIKSLTKETAVLDGDITSVLGTINNFVKTNPGILEDAKNELSIGGYGGKTFG